MHGPSLVELEPRIFCFNSPHGACPRCTGPRIADGDRPRAGRPGSDAVDRRGRDRAVVGERVGLLRPADPGDRRALRRRPGDAVAGAAGRVPASSSCTAPTAQRLQVSYRNRFGRRRSYSTTFEGIVPNLERRYRETDSDWSREKIEEYMTLRPCPECKGARLRPESRAVLVGDTAIHEFTALSARRALEWVARAGAVRARPADRAAGAARDRGAAAVPRERRRRVPVDGAGGVDAVGRRGAADPARHADRLVAGRRAVHPRRAVDRAAPARQREADRDARAAARPRQHGARGRARRGHDAGGRSSRRHGSRAPASTAGTWSRRAPRPRSRRSRSR